jgi:aspartate/tyrosine/aromatic aminotransferase
MNNLTSSAFDHVEATSWDPIVEILEEYRLCEDPNKINLTIGAYRDENLQPIVFKCVREAENRIFSQGFSRAYLSPTGDEEFNQETSYTIFPKEHKVHNENKILSVQSISGSGGLRLGAEFLSQSISKVIYIPHLTWPNHFPIFGFAGMETMSYRYYDENTKLLDEKGLLEDLEAAENGSVVLLHVCGQNPTGVDPDLAQWQKIVEIMKRKSLFPFFDNAYQGYVTGDLDNDIYPIHLFYDHGFEMMISHSFSKSMGLYGERAGPLHFITKDSQSLPKIKDILTNLALGLYLTPVGHGSRIIKTVLADQELKKMWIDELKEVSNRLNSVRVLLYEALIKVKVHGSWEHIKFQKGMFSYTGLNKQQCETLIKKHKIFLVKTGRISLSGLNAQNVEKVALAIKDVVEN